MEKGLVRSVHAPDDLLPAARALAREIADNAAPVSVAVTRQLIWRMAGAPHPMDAHMADSRAIQLRSAMRDVREGVESFLEKRPPRFPDSVSRDLPDIWPHWTAPAFR
jgi:enoyl-CoA hydratase/carnithine racemase